MKRTIWGYIFVSLVILVLVGCKSQKNSSQESSINKPSTLSSNISQSNESTQSSSFVEQNPYGLKAPNEFYTHLIATNATGNEYLKNNGYYAVLKTDTTNPNQSFVIEKSTLLPNINDGYGTQTYIYFWCNSEVKSILANVQIDDTIIFFEANGEYLNQLKNTPRPLQEDLDIEAINNGDISSLVGTWQNGTGDSIVINADGTTNKNQTIHTIKDSDKTSKIPYASLSTGEMGGSTPIGFFKVGFENPDGDNSDTTKPRLILSQQGGAYPAENYYYRQ